MAWTQFWDMHSGGRTKEEPYNHIYIEAAEDEATTVFYNRFGHNPNRVSCTCCGEDYSISTHENLTQLTGYERGCRSLATPRDPATGLYQNDDPIIVAHGYLEADEEPPAGYEADARFAPHPYQTIEEYVASGGVLLIRAHDITKAEKSGPVPKQGYVWAD